MGKKVKTLTLSSDASYMQCNTIFIYKKAYKAFRNIRWYYTEKMKKINYYYIRYNMYDVQDGLYTYEVIQNGSKLHGGTITILK
jgi:hypothetical protein